MLRRLIDQIMPDAEALGCAAELDRCQTIMQFGSSADSQIKIYRESGGRFEPVTRWILETTMAQSRPTAEPAQALGCTSVGK